MRELDAALRASPAVREQKRRAETDPQAQARIAADRPAQQDRLAAGGWRQRYDGTEGLGMWDHPHGRRVIHSVAREDDGELWAHVSCSRRDMSFPSWLETERACWLLYPDLAGVIVVAPRAEHVNLSEVSHVWVKLTGGRPVPDFTHGLRTI